MSASQETPYTADWLRGALSESKKESMRDPPLAPCGNYSRKVGADFQIAPDAKLMDGYAMMDGRVVEVRDGMIMGHAEPARGLDLNDHEIAQVVNELRRLALEYGGSQQLRERIAHYIKPILRGEQRP